MRINRFIALATGMSRRAADAVIEAGEVTVNNIAPQPGMQVTDTDIVSYRGTRLSLPKKMTTILLNKPAGYVCSRDGQGSKTIYELLPTDYHSLKPIGRLDKDSSGLLLLTNNGALAQELTHPSFHKVKIYEIEIDKPLTPLHHQMISDIGIQLYDGPSKLSLERLREGAGHAWKVTMHEGRNRQVRRTFEALGYTVTKLHRTQFGTYTLGSTPSGLFREV